MPQLVRLHWLGVILYIEKSPVGVLVRARAWVVGLVPNWGMCKRQLIDVSLPLSFSLTISLELIKEKKFR